MEIGAGDDDWDIKGFIGVSEGITAVYQFERELNTTITSQPGGRTVYVELSSEYSRLTTGQILSTS